MKFYAPPVLQNTSNSTCLENPIQVVPYELHFRFNFFKITGIVMGMNLGLTCSTIRHSLPLKIYMDVLAALVLIVPHLYFLILKLYGFVALLIFMVLSEII